MFSTIPPIFVGVGQKLSALGRLLTVRNYAFGVKIKQRKDGAVRRERKISRCNLAYLRAILEGINKRNISGIGLQSPE